MSNYLKLLIRNNCVNKVVNCLCYIDVLSLLIAYPHLKMYIDKNLYNISQIIEQRMLSYGYIGYILFHNLKKFKCFVSGSFILQCIFDVEWESDIDVYFFSETDTIKEGSYLMDMININFKLINEGSDNANISESGMYNHKLYAKSINYIVVNRTYKIGNIYDFVENTYDLNICKNIFDGKRLYIKNINELITRSTTINNKCITNNFNGRVKKYIQRGISILE